jgi:menaquinone-dependent protoporphyrinogen oxidase
MKTILVAYASHSGSTRQVAEFIGQELTKLGAKAEVQACTQVTDLTPYDAVVAGGMVLRFNWHPEVVQFVQAHQAALKDKPAAYFACCLGLTKTSECEGLPFPLYLDPTMVKEPKNPGKLGAMEKGSTLSRYVGAVLPHLKQGHTAGLAFFAGKLDLQVLSLPERLAMRAIGLFTGTGPGDYRNWAAIRTWTAEMFGALSQ